MVDQCLSNRKPRRDTDLVSVVRHETPYQQALDWMRNQIASGTWSVGARIPTEPELTELLGIGRNTVREAIKTLTSTGVLEIRRGSGTFVRARSDLGGLLGRRVAVGEIGYVVEVRRALELEAVRLACDRRTDDDLAALERALADWGMAGRADFNEVDIRFHLTLVEAAHNPLLSELFAGILEPLRVTYDLTQGVHEPAASVGYHRTVVDALRDRDLPGALKAAEGYLNLQFDAVEVRKASRAES